MIVWLQESKFLPPTPPSLLCIPSILFTCFSVCGTNTLHIFMFQSNYGKICLSFHLRFSRHLYTVMYQVSSKAGKRAGFFFKVKSFEILTPITL